MGVSLFTLQYLRGVRRTNIISERFLWQVGKIVSSGIDAKSIFWFRLRLFGTVRLFVRMMCIGCNGFVLLRLKRIRLVILSSKDETPNQRSCFQLFDGNPCMTLKVIIEKNLIFITPFNDEEMV